MIRNDLNRFKMFESVLKVLETHQPVWQGNPAFVDLYNEYAGKMVELHTIVKVHQSLTKGIRDQRDVLLKDSVDKAHVLNGVLVAYAIKIKDFQLLKRNQVTVSAWRTGTAIVRIEKLRILKDDVEANLSALGEYGVTQAFLDEFELSIDAYVVVANSPVNKRQEGKELTFEEKVLIESQINFLKNNIDKLIEIFRKDHPKFVQHYFICREIHQTGGRPKIIKGEIPPDIDDGTQMK